MKKRNYKNLDPEKLMRIIKDQQVRRTLTYKSHWWFFHIYLPHYIKYKIAEFQKEFFELTEDTTHRMIIVEAFRGSGKTTIMQLSYVIWAILGVLQKKSIVLIARTEQQARQYLKNIKIELTANKLLFADLGPFEEPNDEWRANSIVLPKYNARITVISCESSMRGMRHGAIRPDLIIADDLETLETVKTSEGRDKLFNWLVGDVIPAGDENTQIVLLGTALHNDSLIMRLKKAISEGRMDRIAKRYPFLKSDGTAMWPEKFSTKASIEKVRKSLPSVQAFEREYMLNIVATDTQIIQSEWVQRYKELPSAGYRYTATAVDPAISERDGADCTAMVTAKVYGRGKDLKIHILPNPVNERMNFTKTKKKIRSLSQIHGVSSAIYIENVGYQRALIEQLVSEGLPVKEYKADGSDKASRLWLVADAIESAKVLFPEKGVKDLVTQLLGFPSERHDDLVDALCFLILSIMKRETQMFPGYEPLFSETNMKSPSSDPPSLPLPQGEKRLGVVLAGAMRSYSAIVLRTDTTATVLYHGDIADSKILADKVIELALNKGIPLKNTLIFADNSGRGQAMCDYLKERGEKTTWGIEDPYLQNYGVSFSGYTHYYNKDRYANFRSYGFWKLSEWIRNSGYVGDPAFDDLPFYLYATEENNKIKVIENERLVEMGIDTSIPDALMLTIVVDKVEEINMIPYNLPIDPKTGYFM